MTRMTTQTDNRKFLKLTGAIRNVYSTSTRAAFCKFETGILISKTSTVSGTYRNFHLTSSASLIIDHYRRFALASLHVSKTPLAMHVVVGNNNINNISGRKQTVDSSTY
eukprot:scaffold6556_cov73-Skeletonema_dohrnii-CCMP3373.AAC.2